MLKMEPRAPILRNSKIQRDASSREETKSHICKTQVISTAFKLTQDVRGVVPHASCAHGASLVRQGEPAARSPLHPLRQNRKPTIN